MDNLACKEIKIHPLSHRGDQTGSVFFLNGSLYRGINQSSEKRIRRIIDSPAVKKLMAAGKIQSSFETNISIPPFSLIFEHSILSPVTYPFEWCDEMAKDAASFILDLCNELGKDNLVIEDPHPWNIVFKYTSPIFVDLGAIEEINQQELPSWPFWSGYWNFKYGHLNRLALSKQGLGSAARSQMLVYHAICDNSVPPESFFRQVVLKVKSIFKKYLSESIKKPFRVIRARTQKAKIAIQRASNLTLGSILELKRRLETVTPPSPDSVWTHYYESDEDEKLFTQNRNSWSIKQQNVWRLCGNTTPTQILDIGCNTGWYSILFAAKNIPVIALDSDAACISRLYVKAKEKNLPITPVIMNFTSPSPALGGGSRKTLHAEERFSSDVVLALALIHHCVLRGGCSFDTFFETLTPYCTRYLLIEFIHPQDPVAIRFNVSKMPWYTEETFKKALSEKFNILEILPSSPETRTLYWCETIS